LVFELATHRRAKGRFFMGDVSAKTQLDPEKASSSEAEHAFVSVIIPHYNDLENLRICLALLARQTYPRERFEIIVADNNSACGLASITEACAGARVISAPIQGAAEARNFGVRAARGDILAFIDSDCRPADRWLECGVAALKRADLVGGRVEVDVVNPANPTAVEAFEKIFAFDYRRYIEKKGFAVTANMLVPRSVFDKVGEFRGGVSEDVDWGQRALRQGYRWYCAEDCVIRHPARRNWNELTKKWRRMTRESFLRQKEHSGWRLRWIGRTLLLPISPFVHIFRVFAYRESSGPAFKTKAAAVLFAIRFWRFKEGLGLLFR
jgi:glycosyltransferase involved in cell wall biosynthesis